jgi:hypothetical protein
MSLNVLCGPAFGSLDESHDRLIVSRTAKSVNFQLFPNPAKRMRCREFYLAAQHQML